MLGIGSLPMKPSWASPQPSAPAACVVARCWPNVAAASTGVFALCSTHARMTQSLSAPSTSGTGSPPSTSPSQRSPAASASKNPAGAWGSVFISAVWPLESRSRVAVAMSPPATGDVATTDEPRSSSARFATSG